MARIVARRAFGGRYAAARASLPATPDNGWNSRWKRAIHALRLATVSPHLVANQPSLEGTADTRALSRRGMRKGKDTPDGAI
jgi:hypothetical protein